MPYSYTQLFGWLRLKPTATDTTSSLGDLQANSTDNTVHLNNGTTVSSILTATQSAEGAMRVQNKDLDASNIQFVDPTDTTKKLNFSESGAITGTELTLAGVQTANRTLTLPDATDTLVAQATTQTLSNKTLTAPIINNGSITGSAITATNSDLTTPDITGGTITSADLIDCTLTGTSIGSISSVQPANASGTNAPGTTLSLLGGNSTGNAVGGEIELSLTYPGSSGSGVNSPTTVATVTQFGSTGVDFTLGVPGSLSATVDLSSTNGHAVTLNPGTPTDSYVWRYPTLPGTEGQGLTSGGGVLPMTWTTFLDQPTLPSVTSLLTIASNGAVSTGLPITTGQQVSASFTSSTTNSVFQNISGATVTITTHGNPVVLMLMSDGTSPSFVFTTTGTGGQIRFVNNQTTSAYPYQFGSGGGAGSIPSSSVTAMDIVAAGTYTYIVQIANSSGNTTGIENTILVAYELK